MNIKRLVIENFKSIERIELIEPNPFTVFVGPNGAGKSNIFEALEFVNKCSKTLIREVFREFGGVSKVCPRNGGDLGRFYFRAEFSDTGSTEIKFAYNTITDKISLPYSGEDSLVKQFSDLASFAAPQFYAGFSRIFINNTSIERLKYPDDQALDFFASNLEPVLKRILQNEVLRNEIFEWLELFVPGFKAVEIDDRNELHWFEESTADYFTKDLISDGTKNILALLTAVYQSDDKPQFLCIEEPENGLHPQVARELVDFFRLMCEERGHYIWLNTHSQSMVSRLTPEEMVVVEKKHGATQVTQLKGRDMHGLRMDEALLMNVLGVGLAW